MVIYDGILFEMKSYDCTAKTLCCPLSILSSLVSYLWGSYVWFLRILMIKHCSDWNSRVINDSVFCNSLLLILMSSGLCCCQTFSSYSIAGCGVHDIADRYSAASQRLLGFGNEQSNVNRKSPNDSHSTVQIAIHNAPAARECAQYAHNAKL